MNEIKTLDYEQLVADIGSILSEGRNRVASAINTTLVQTYWTIGRHIVEFEQQGKDRAEYGESIINKLSSDLTARFGKGFNRSNLQYMRKFYTSFPNCTTLSCNLSWSHYVEILKGNDPLEISFYSKQCEKENWSVRELKRQRDSMLFHRLALSKDKAGILSLAELGHEVQTPEDVVKDPYVLEFLNLPQKERYLEGDIENEIIKNLQTFLLELGKGFAFIGRQYKITIGGRHFFVDLVFYHRILKCFVLIDLKRNEIEHNDIGQMNLYLNYFSEEENTEGDNPPIGIVLGAYKDEILIKYALSGITNQLFVSKYQLYLPDEASLRHEVQKVIEQ
ncbi:MAG: DUF1016 family protein [Bacteroidales bacterium]|nr:DUF1016 family protein [Bacteroidales bacterium]